MEITNTFQFNYKEWAIIHEREKIVLNALMSATDGNELKGILDSYLNGVLRNDMYDFFVKCYKDNRSLDEIHEFVDTVGVGKLVWKMILVMYYHDPDRDAARDEQLDVLTKTISYWGPSYASELAIMITLYHDFFCPIHLDLLKEQSDEEVPENTHPFRMEYLDFDMWSDWMWDEWIMEGWSQCCAENNLGVETGEPQPVTLYSNSIFLKVLMGDPRIIDVIIHLRDAGILSDGFTVTGGPYFNFMGPRFYLYQKDVKKRDGSSVSVKHLESQFFIAAYLRANQANINDIVSSEVEKYGYELEIGDECKKPNDYSPEFRSYKIKKYSHNYPINIVDECLEYTDCATFSDDFGEKLSAWAMSKSSYTEEYGSVIINFIRSGYQFMQELLWWLFNEGDPDQPIHGLNLHSYGETAPQELLDELNDLVVLNTPKNSEKIMEEDTDDSEQQDDGSLVVNLEDISLKEDTPDESGGNEKPTDSDVIHWDEFVMNLKRSSAHAYRIGAKIDIDNHRLQEGEVICGFPTYFLFLDYTIHSEMMLDWIMGVARKINTGEYNTNTIHNAASDMHRPENEGLFYAEMYQMIPIHLSRYMGLVIPNHVMSNTGIAVRDMTIDEMLRDGGIVYKKDNRYEDKCPKCFIYHLPDSMVYAGYYHEGLKIAFQLMSIEYRDQIPSILADASKISINTIITDMLATIFKLVGKRENGCELLDQALGYAARLYERWLNKYMYDHFKASAELIEQGFYYSIIRPTLDIYINPEVWRDRGRNVEIALPPYVKYAHSVVKYDNLF